MSSCTTNTNNEPQIVGRINIQDVNKSVFELFNPLYQGAPDVEYLAHPHTGAILFSSDRQYYTEDNNVFSPFTGELPKGSGIYDDTGKLVIGYKDFIRVIYSLEYSIGNDPRKNIALANLIEEFLNSIQNYRDVDTEYLIKTADPQCIARLNGTEAEYLQDMTDNGHIAESHNPQRFGSSAVTNQQYGLVQSNSLTIQQVIGRLESASKSTARTSAEGSMSSVIAGKNSYAESLKDYKSDSNGDEIVETEEKLKENEWIDVSDIDGVFTATPSSKQYVHNVVGLAKTPEEIFVISAFGAEARYCLDEMHMRVVSKLISNTPILKALEDRACSSLYGWDVYKVEFNARKNCIDILYVHDLRLHEWNVELSHKYRKKG